MSNFTADNGNLTLDVILSAANILFSVTAIVGNYLILKALRKVLSLHSPTKLLLSCLAVTDIFVGFIPQPLFAVTIIAGISTKNDLDPGVLLYITKIKSFSSYLLCTVSVFTSCAVSVDRLLALFLGIRYRHIVTVRCVLLLIFSFWFIGASCGLIYIWRLDIAWSLVLVSLIILLLISSFSYTKIYLKLRHLQAQVHMREHFQLGATNAGRTSLNIARYRKTVESIWWVQVAFILCYVPFGVGTTLRIHGGLSGSVMEIARNFVVTLTYFNSSLNPFLYCYKMREVRRAVKITIGEITCHNIN